MKPVVEVQKADIAFGEHLTAKTLKNRFPKVYPSIFTGFDSVARGKLVVTGEALSRIDYPYWIVLYCSAHLSGE